MPHTQRQQVCSWGQRSSLLLPLVLTLLSLSARPGRAALQIPADYHIDKKPPEITKQPVSATVFAVEDFSMSCGASGSPPPIFRWTKDGEEFDPGTDPELKVSESVDSFSFSTLSNSMDTLKQYQGKYVCYASNELGTAMSKEAVLRTDVPPSQQKEKPVTHRAEQGNSFVLRCDPPQSSMELTIHWMDMRFRHIPLNKRVVVGKDGSLYFAHLTLDDNRNDYTCNVQYLATRTIFAKEPITLIVNPSNSVVRNRRPAMMRPTGSSSVYHALRDDTIELECIVNGLPTPEIKWLKKNGELSETRAKKEMFDRRLQLINITESDSGEYQCIAENSQGKVTHTYMLTVEASPYWKKVPESQIYAPGENVRLDCEAKGTPTPVMSWTINGTPLSAIDKEPRRSVTGNTSLILKDVIFGDTAIYQCKASNKHGTILTNTYVYVIELPPQILTEDRKLYQVTEGQSVVMDCETFGSPKPKVMWDRETSSLLADPRVNLLTSGELEIFEVTHDDKGFYTCSVQNHNLSISSELQVFNKTVIVTPPTDLKVQPGNIAVFTCVGFHDIGLEDPIIQWRKNKKKLFESPSDEKYAIEGSVFMIANVEPEDEGVYTCEVITNLDKADASATLSLYDRPDPPSLLQISDPVQRAVTLSWTPGDNHNSLVQEYVVEFEDQRFREKGWEELQRVKGNQERALLSLWPYMSYRFRVIAINEVGKSNPSKPSEIHNTPAEAPDNNPKDVRSESSDPNNLVIVWEKIDYRNFNGPEFKYKVQWRRVLGSGPKWHESNTTAPPLIVNDVGDFSAFEIKVQAINEVGEGPEPDPVIGYSGEDVPLEAPMDVGIELINSTTIKVSWAAVNRETVRGHLMGYKIYVTRRGSRGHHRGRRSREFESTMIEETGPNDEKKVISNLRPYSHYELAITVFNKKGEGPRSEPMDFETQEGEPGPPTSLILDSPSETNMTLHWTPPAHPNGILIGYLLQYQRITENDDSPMQVEKLDDPTVTHFTLTNLDRHSEYQFYVRGRTNAGDGEPIKMRGATTLDGETPKDVSISVGENLVNVSWVAKKRHKNIGFYIHYKKNDGGKWKTSEKVNYSQAFYQLQGLSPGSHYDLHFIHGNATFQKMTINTAGTEVTEVQQSIATQGWFISVVSAIVLLVLIMLIFCFIKRSKGGKYSVKDKEDGPMDSEARPMKDETFGEYRSLESDLEEKQTASQPSLCEDNKMCSEDTLNFNGSSVLTTEVNMDESLVSQISRPSVGPEGFHSLPDNSTLNPAANGVPNSVNILN